MTMLKWLRQWKLLVLTARGPIEYNYSMPGVQFCFDGFSSSTLIFSPRPPGGRRPPPWRIFWHDCARRPYGSSLICATSSKKKYFHAVFTAKFSCCPNANSAEPINYSTPISKCWIYDFKTTFQRHFSISSTYAIQYFAFEFHVDKKNQAGRAQKMAPIGMFRRY